MTVTTTHKERGHALLPKWLYEERVDRYGFRTRRWGSRRPLRLVLTIFDGDEWPAAYMLGIGKLGVQVGPEDGVTEGHAGMPPGSRAHAWFPRRGWAIGVSWDGCW